MRIPRHMSWTWKNAPIGLLHDAFGDEVLGIVNKELRPLTKLKKNYDYMKDGYKWMKDEFERIFFTILLDTFHVMGKRNKEGVLHKYNFLMRYKTMRKPEVKVNLKQSVINVEKARRVAIKDIYIFEKMKMTKKGFTAKCPFHSPDANPSFSVYYTRNGDERFKCWSCSAAGDVLEFVMRLHQLNFPDAVKWLERVA